MARAGTKMRTRKWSIGVFGAGDGEGREKDEGGKRGESPRYKYSSTPRLAVGDAKRSLVFCAPFTVNLAIYLHSYTVEPIVVQRGMAGQGSSRCWPAAAE